MGECCSNQNFPEEKKIYNSFKKIEKENNIEFNIINYDEKCEEIHQLTKNKIRKHRPNISLTINTKKFNQIYQYKNLASLYQQNVTENNYMKPLKLYRTSEKYNLPTNTTNFETYKIMKEKYFSKDIQSTIAKGKKLNKTDFIKEKENIMKNKDNTKFKKIEEIKVEQNQERNNKERKRD